MRASQRIIGLVIISLMTVSCTHTRQDSEPNRIINARSSAVLDGGSYTVDLFFGSNDKPLHLFIANPTGREKQREGIWIVAAEGLGRLDQDPDGDRAAGRRSGQNGSGFKGLLPKSRW